jgi:arylsulfatase A-like enzyme
MRTWMQQRVRVGGMVILALIVGLVFALQPVSTYAVLTPQTKVLSQGTLDATGATGKKFQKISYTTPANLVGDTTVSLKWDGAGVLAMNMFDATNTKLNQTVQPVNNALSYTLTLSSSTAYSISIWSKTGAGNYTLSALTYADVVDGGNQDRPNIIVVNTDDQRADDIRQMPKMLSWMRDGGTYFPNGYVPTPSCCPSRATLMSGRYVHNNGQYEQMTLGYDLTATTQRYLQEGGYFTGHCGKFLHWVDLSVTAPYHDKWTYFKGGYNNVWYNLDGTVKKLATNSTVNTFTKASEYINDFDVTDDSKPFYLYVAPIAPHGPSTPEPQYANATVLPRERVASHDETDRSDKPAFIRNVTSTFEDNQSSYEDRVRTLMTVDDQFDAMMRTLEARGELDNTLVIYTSDNGYLLGEHLRQSKFLPYLEAVRVPFFVRWPGKIAAGATDSRYISHVDVSPSLLAAANVTLPETAPAQDGTNFLGTGTATRPVAYTEYYFDTANAPGIPSWSAISTGEYHYIEYYGKSRDRSTVSFREYYDLVNDPYETQNLLGDNDPVNDPDVAALGTTLRQYRDCAGAACHD